jgi:YVTN family beta-propeller protein
MTTPSTAVERRREAHRRRRRRARARLAALLCFLGAGAIIAVAVAVHNDRPPAAQGAIDPTARGGASAVERTVTPPSFRLAERHTGRLQQPVQDGAAVALPGGAMLLAGLSAADTSRADIRLVTPAADRAAGQLPVSLHDTAAVRIGHAVYLFGGGTGSNTQSDQVIRVSDAGTGATVVAHLPALSSDQSAAAIGGTAFIVGGFTGTHWLNTIVAWRPGAPARVVARLPFSLRYAAVAASGSRLVIAGGSLVDGSASAAILEYTPGRAGVRAIGHLPSPTTHAAAAALGGLVYVIGGRSAVIGTPTRRIVAIDPATGRTHAGGTLSAASSDLAAVSDGTRILLVGGRGHAGTQDSIDELVPAKAAPAIASAFTTQSIARAGAGVYAHDSANNLTGAARFAKPLIYVPNSQSDTVDVIDPKTYRVIRQFAVGGLPQHVVPAWDLRTLYVTNDTGNSLTPIDPRTGKPRGAPIPVDDPYNMYFTPDGRYAIIVAERLHRLDFRNAHSFKLHRSLQVPCSGVDHMDFTADGRFLVASCEFSGQLVVVDVRHERVVRTITLPDGTAGMPQDVKLAPDGTLFYVADMHANGVWEVNATTFRVLRLLPTGAGAHGLYPSRDAKLLYVTNRAAGSISVVRFRTRTVIATWHIPGGGSPDMGGVSADGKVLWLSGRYNAEVYAISTKTGHLIARIPVGSGPHGLSVWPQPGRYSLGHTGILR